MPAVLIVVADANVENEAHWSSSLAVEGRDGDWEVDVVALADAGAPLALWELVTAIDRATVVHVARPYTRGGEVALLAGKLLGKPIAVSDLAVETSALGRSIEALRLADVIVAATDGEADAHAPFARVEVADPANDGWVAQLFAVYRELVATHGGER
jgi:hypothetical protein